MDLNIGTPAFQSIHVPNERNPGLNIMPSTNLLENTQYVRDKSQLENVNAIAGNDEDESLIRGNTRSPAFDPDMPLGTENHGTEPDIASSGQLTEL